MRKFSILLVAVIFIFPVSTSAFATTYDLTESYNGWWAETFSDGVGPGQFGNELMAGSFLGQWDMFGLLLQTADPTGNPGEYSTVYEGGALTLYGDSAAPWGPDDIMVTDLYALNTSVSDGMGNLNFHITITGTDDSHRNYTVEAAFNGVLGDNYIFEPGAAHYSIGEEGFSSLSLTIPEPATMLLLGTGLITLAGLRRKRIF